MPRPMLEVEDPDRIGGRYLLHTSAGCYLVSDRVFSFSKFPFSIPVTKDLRFRSFFTFFVGKNRIRQIDGS